MKDEELRDEIIYIQFKSDLDFARFRDEVRLRYDRKMVQPERHMVKSSGETIAIIKHARGLGAELKGLAWNYFEGRTWEGDLK